MTPSIYHNHDGTCSACERERKAFEAMREALRDVLPVACDGIDARDRDGAENADEGQAAIEKARAALALADAAAPRNPGDL